MTPWYSCVWLPKKSKCARGLDIEQLDIKSDKINEYYERAVKRKQYINAMIESYGQPTLEKYILENR